MQARDGRDTVILGGIALSLALVVGCVGATRLSISLALLGSPALGDHIRISPSMPNSTLTVQARLASGKTCEIGSGSAATAGGDLYVIARDSRGWIEAIWSSDGRSAIDGADCGNGAEVTLDGLTFSGLTAASRGLSAMPLADAPAVF